MKYYEELLIDRFAWSDVYDIAREVIKRIDASGDTEDELKAAIESTKIRTADKWKLCEHYATPDNCDWDAVIDAFYNDLLEIAEAYSEC